MIRYPSTVLISGLQVPIKDAATMVKQLGGIQGLMEKTKPLGLSSNEPDAVRAGADSVEHGIELVTERFAVMKKQVSV